MTNENSNNNNNNTTTTEGFVPFETLTFLDSLGFKLVPLYLNSNPSIEQWSPIYNNVDYWSIEKLKQEAYRFEGVATALGKTKKTDLEGKNLYLIKLDCDSEPVFKFLSLPIAELHEVLQIMVNIKTKHHCCQD
jgi:hypothetical protein